MKKRYLFAILLTSTAAHAGFNGLTAHSRANCLTINESISWDATRKWDLYVTAFHYRWNGSTWINQHKDISSGTYDHTWRAASVHVGEARSGQWRVTAEHWIIEKDKKKLLQKTEAINCNIYDGWWDSDHPERRS
jgi:hypothetical protein